MAVPACRKQLGDLLQAGPGVERPRASSRFRAGLADIPGATIETAGQILDEMATGWSRLSVDMSSALFKFMFSRGFDQALDHDDDQLEAMRRVAKRIQR